MICIVPSEFLINEVSTCRATPNKTIPNHDEYRLGCHCIEMHENCRKILWFLVFDGRFNVKSNTEIIYREATTSFANVQVNNFNEMVENVAMKIFEKRLSHKYSFLINQNLHYEQVARITTEENCIQFGLDCTVALHGLNEVLNRVFRLSYVLNQDLFPENEANNTTRRDRYYGTLLVNKHFDYLVPQNQIDQMTPETFQLNTDLQKILGIMLHAQNLSLIEFIGMLGYEDISESTSETYESKLLKINEAGCTLLNKNRDGCLNLKQLFKRGNIKAIMSLIKYSLDMTDSWLPHFHNLKDKKDGPLILKTREMYKSWIARKDNDLRKLILNDFGAEMLHGWRYVSYSNIDIAYNCLNSYSKSLNLLLAIQINFFDLSLCYYSWYRLWNP